jgi:uncharacterized protein
MKLISILLFVFVSNGIAMPQTPEIYNYIEVIGSAEMEVDPDQILLIIGIEEYWKEEFQKKTDYKDYQTKVPLLQIEKSLMTVLTRLGIPKDKVIIKDVGNYYRNRGKDFLMSKQFELWFGDYSAVDSIVSKLNIRGISYIRIGELKNKGMIEYRKQVKIEALRAAKEKANYLLNSIQKEIGGVLSIVELDENLPFWNIQSMASNAVINSNDSGDTNFRKIKLRYEVKVRFEIK